MNKSKLIPLDLKRCQAMIREPSRPFILGGPCVLKFERCKHVPTFIAKEIEPGEDGQRGLMALCAICKGECEKQRGGEIQFKPIPKPRGPGRHSR